MNAVSNGRLKTATISAFSAVLVAGIATASWYGGWASKVGAEAVRARLLDDHLAAASDGFKRLSTVEAAAATNGQNIAAIRDDMEDLKASVRALIQAQEQLNKTLMEYLASQAKQRGGQR
jgi:hypothetical protein